MHLMSNHRLTLKNCDVHHLTELISLNMSVMQTFSETSPNVTVKLHKDERQRSTVNNIINT